MFLSRVNERFIYYIVFNFNMKDTEDLKTLRQEVEDIKALLILLLQNEKVENAKIADAIGMSPGRVSQLVNKNKYPRK